MMGNYDLEELGRKNRYIRGCIIRSLVGGDRYRMPIKQISNILARDQLIISPDISTYLEYLEEKGYIAFTNDRITAFTAYANCAVARLTSKGVDLVDQTIKDDGVDI